MQPCKESLAGIDYFDITAQIVAIRFGQTIKTYIDIKYYIIDIFISIVK